MLSGNQDKKTSFRKFYKMRKISSIPYCICYHLNYVIRIRLSCYRYECPDQIERLEAVIKELKQTVAGLEREQRQTASRVCEQTAELDHIKAELTDSRSQYRNCAQEVGTSAFIGRTCQSLQSIFYSFI